MIRFWRLSWLHFGAFSAGLLIVLGVLVHSTIERVNQLNLVSASTILATVDAVAAAIEDDARAGAWETVQDRLRAMTSQHLRLRYRVATADGIIRADSGLIQATGRLAAPLAARALAEGRALTAEGAHSYEVLAAQPLPANGGAEAATAVLMVDASWERAYLEARQAIERETVSAAMVLVILIIGAFVVVWRLGVQPLHHLRRVATDETGGQAPTFKLTDLQIIGEALNRLRDREAALLVEIAELARARDAAEAANTAKSDFLARMSHDLRTPLHGIIGFAEMIRDQMVGPIGTMKYLDYARDIHHSGAHLLCLINDVLDLSKIEAGRFDLADNTIWIGAAISEAVHGVSPLADRSGLKLSVNVADDLPALTADEKTVRQMLFNLLSNAIKFTAPGGNVTVSATRSSNGLHVTVTDTGIGIDPSDIDQMFTEFGQGGNPRSRPAEGTGLGLVIVRSLIELHGGHICLRSEPGNGTAVTLTFPPGRVGRPLPDLMAVT